MLEDGNIRNSIHSYSLDSKLENSDDKNANDKTEKATLKVYLSNGNFNIVKFGEITSVKVYIVLHFYNLETFYVIEISNLLTFLVFPCNN